MKIGKPAEIQQSELLRTAQIANTRVAGGAGSGAIGKTEAAANVRLSDTSRSLAAEAAGPDRSIRSEKVAEIRLAIAEGRFKVNAEVIADKMISEATQLLTIAKQ
jgi:negative regulator of flagellin synthesis FlgM